MTSSTSTPLEQPQTIPANFSLLYSAAEIAQRVNAMGEEISAWCSGVWHDSHTDVLVIPVLRGGIFFFSDLARQIKGSLEIVPVKTEGYRLAVNGKLNDRVLIDLKGLAVKGRVVLIVDDVSDSGRTLEALERAISELGAREVRTAVLVRRLLDTPSFVPCWVGFQYSGPEWFVGYGMDDCERWRNLKDVYVIRNPQSS
jgi:hypoxanthine phosphoribosyltransferase